MGAWANDGPSLASTSSKPLCPDQVLPYPKKGARQPALMKPGTFARSNEAADLHTGDGRRAAGFRSGRAANGVGANRTT